MLGVLFFSISISIDAIGYALGFGSRDVKLTIKQFFLINTLNILILALFLNIFPYISFLANYPFLENLGSYLLLVFGFYYIFLAYKSLVFDLKKWNKQKKYKFLQKNDDYLHLLDILLLLSIFVIENIFSTIVFYSSLGYKNLFLLFVFVFHSLFFLIGFFMGNRIIKRISLNTSFLSGCIFVLLALENLR